jgi:2,4-dienoyl-CoA reductase-like NADH-dependent reductase (Old Yellow Enzyme family)
MSTPKFPRLLSPGRIGPVELRNRIVLAPMGSYMGGLDGHITERHKRFYEERARGGAGLITTEVVAVDWPQGAAMVNQLGLSDDAFIPGLRDLTDRIHALGAKISVQLQHAGKVAVKDLAEGRPLSVPSANVVAMEGVLNDLTAEEIAAILKNYTKVDPTNMFREIDEEEILRIIRCFADAAERAKRAGFDAVEIHAGHGYLIHEFLSPHCNFRTDRWGGPLENRARFLCEVLRETRRKVGNDIAVWCRLDGEEKDVKDGIQREAAIETARMAVAAGADAIHVTRYGGPSGVGFSAMIVHEPGELLPYAEAIKKAVSVPVIAVGRLLPEIAERAIADGQADFVAMARQLLADPALPSKLAQGRREDVRPCIHCYTCVGQIFVNEVVKCAVNPACAREAEFEITPVATPRRVLVVGGGTAGMEAARLAALRGHNVTLCEKSERLGGTLWFAALVYEPNGQLLEYLEAQVRKLPIELKLGQEVTPALVRQLKPDVVLVAVGARRQPPPIPGVDRPNVFSGDDLRSLMTGGDKKVAAEKLSLAQRSMLKMGSLVGISDRVALSRDLSRHWMPLGRRVVIIGGGLVGLELAEFLVERDREVTVVEEGPAFAREMSIPRRWRALHILRAHHVTLLADSRVDAITDAGVVYTHNGGQQTAPADSVILASGVQDNRGLAEALAGTGAEVHLVGDCKGVGYIEGALLDANRIARQI